MKPSAQTKQQIERLIRKVAEKFPATAEPVLTDIHLQVKPSSGEILVFDDDDREITRCVVEQWIGQPEEFYDEAACEILRGLKTLRETFIDKMAIMRPFSFVLVDEDHETLRDLYLVDDDTFLLTGPLLEGFDEELDQFLKELLA